MLFPTMWHAILTFVDSYEYVQPLFSLETPNDVQPVLTLIESSSDLQRL